MNMKRLAVFILSLMGTMGIAGAANDVVCVSGDCTGLDKVAIVGLGGATVTWTANVTFTSANVIDSINWPDGTKSTSAHSGNDGTGGGGGAAPQVGGFLISTQTVDAGGNSITSVSSIAWVNNVASVTQGGSPEWFLLASSDSGNAQMSTITVSNFPAYKQMKFVFHSSGVVLVGGNFSVAAGFNGDYLSTGTLYSNIRTSAGTTTSSTTARCVVLEAITTRVGARDHEMIVRNNIAGESKSFYWVGSNASISFSDSNPNNISGGGLWDTPYQRIQQVDMFFSINNGSSFKPGSYIEVHAKPE